jgi:nicotinate-nucleotide--dimethylbenzimidazole phosphoribosyltransferase
VSTPTAALVSAVTGMEPVDATTRGSGIDDAAWIRKAAIVRDARFRTTRTEGDVVSLLRTAGGPDLAALTGFLAQAAVRRTPVLVDDVPGTLAAVLAHRIAPGADTAVLIASAAPERTHRRLLDLLGAEPVLALSISDGPATAALLAVPLLRCAAQLVDDVDLGAPLERSASAINSWDSGLL